MSSDRVIGEIRAFMAVRDWDQFHSPENPAKSIPIDKLAHGAEVSRRPGAWEE